uniref:Uncharacterized protein n=1 Tax=Callorhinchus milii TaxID=7868 RepID=A0A4W3GZ27_CALMI
MLYRKFIHPTLSSKEKEIDGYLVQAKERSYETMVSFGKRGLNLAATAAVSAAAKASIPRLCFHFAPPSPSHQSWPGSTGSRSPNGSISRSSHLFSKHFMP